MGIRQANKIGFVLTSTIENDLRQCEGDEMRRNNISDNNGWAPSKNLIKLSQDVKKIGQLKAIFEFLKENREPNKIVQAGEHRRIFSFGSDTADQILALLHAAHETQRSANLDAVCKTWQAFHRNRACFDEVQNLESLAIAMRHLENVGSAEKALRPADGRWLDSIWFSLRHADGFGEKTAALFVKNLVNVHRDFKDQGLGFLEDFTLSDDDVIRIPVDAVIKFIFEAVFPKTHLYFDKINWLSTQIDGYQMADALVWDDLWFWGFITQKGGNERSFEVNEAKFWSLLHSPKDKWKDIKKKAQQFISLIPCWAE
jgi:hypothetical protein